MESLHEIRKREVEESARLIGLDDLRLLGYRRPVLQLVAFSNKTLQDLGEPDIVVNIEGYEERKEKIMAAHESQTGPLLKTLAGNTQESEAARQMWMQNETFYSYDID